MLFNFLVRSRTLLVLAATAAAFWVVVDIYHFLQKLEQRRRARVVKNICYGRAVPIQ